MHSNIVKHIENPQMVAIAIRVFFGEKYTGYLRLRKISQNRSKVNKIMMK